MKNFKLLFVAAIILSATLLFVGCGDKKEATFEDVLDDVYKTIRTEKTKHISDYLYEGFGEEYNNVEILSEFAKIDKSTLLDEFFIGDYSFAKGDEDLDELQYYIFERTGKIVNVEEGLYLELCLRYRQYDGEKEAPVFDGATDGDFNVKLIRIDGSWYIFYVSVEDID